MVWCVTFGIYSNIVNSDLNAESNQLLQVILPALLAAMPDCFLVSPEYSADIDNNDETEADGQAINHCITQKLLIMLVFKFDRHHREHTRWSSNSERNIRRISHSLSSHFAY